MRRSLWLLLPLCLLAGCATETLSADKITSLRTAVAATATADSRLSVRITTPTPVIVVPTSTPAPEVTPVPRPALPTPTLAPAGPVVGEAQYQEHWRAIRADLGASLERYARAFPRIGDAEFAIETAQLKRLEEYRYWRTLPTRLRQISPPLGLVETNRLHTELLQQMAIAGESFAISEDPSTDAMYAQAAQQAGAAAWKRSQELFKQIDPPPA